MMYLPLAAGVPFVMKLVGLVWVLSALCLIFIILIQKGKGGGLSGAFGGMGAGGLLGTKTGDFLTWVTIGLVIVFLSLGVIMVKYYKPAGVTDTTPTTDQPQTQTPPAGDTSTPAPEAEPAGPAPTNAPADTVAPPAEGAPAEPADK